MHSSESRETNQDMAASRLEPSVVSRASADCATAQEVDHSPREGMKANASDHRIVASAASDRVIHRLRDEDAPPTEWRREALARYTEGHVEECRHIFEAAVDFDTKSPLRTVSADGIVNMYLLAELYISCIVSSQNVSRDDVEQLLGKTKRLLDQAEALDSSWGSIVGVEAYVAKGFFAITRHVTRCSCEGDELKRAEILFDAALKLDSGSPRALLGKAIVLTQHKEWAKALGHFRQVLKRAAPPAPRSGLRLQTLKHLRFAIATCFCDLGRYEQMRNALGSVVSADPGDVESLCALAHLEAKVSKDGIGKSLEYLDEAVKANQQHPVVLCQLANHAFYCGLEQSPGGHSNENNGDSSPWELATDLLQKALAATKSSKVAAEVHYQLGRLEHAQGRYPSAYAHYQKCCEVLPDHFACAYCLAQSRIQQHKFSEAITGLEAMRRCQGDLPEVLKLLTFAYLMCGDRAADAVKCADHLVAKEKDDMEAWAMRAEAHDQLCAQQPSAPKMGVEVYEHMAALLENGDGDKRASASPQMWNNLGTLRGLQGDPHGAKEAYSKGLELAERLLVGDGGGPSSLEEVKDLHIARLTMRFNRAWLAENEGDEPNYMQATQDYMAINEEHNWYADSLLQLGAQWQRMGEADIAVQRYQEAMKQSPVLATLMQAELHRNQGEYTKALQSAELAVSCAGEKQFHYAHVYLGNLYFEVACTASTRHGDREAYLHKALRNFTKALEHKKDSHYAANGIGMVFAHRGKLDFARRTFQSVMQHHAMGGDPSVFVNLGHTYLQSGGDNARKAIALYERAKRLRPHDLKVRLYLAKAHFRLKEFDRCIGVLGDATQIWPDDLLLRYNLAISLEKFGAHLVSEEKRTQRVVGVDNGMQQMNHAVQLLNSAARLFDYVYNQWMGMTDEERKQMMEASGSSDDINDEMLSASAHQRYCSDIQNKAQEELVLLQAKRADIERRMQENAGFEEEEQKQMQAQQQLATSRQEQLVEDIDRAKDLEEKAKQIDLGKNLEARTFKTAAKPRELKDKKGAKAKLQANGELEASQVVGELGPDDGADDVMADERRDKKHKKDKKSRKDTDAKKDKKRHKKSKKRGRDDDNNEDDDKSLEDGMDDVASPAQSDQGQDRNGQATQEQDVAAEPGMEESRQEKKHDKKHKKDKKAKKHKKSRKHGGADSENEVASADDGDPSDPPEQGDADNKAMEEELFGPDGDE
mmetsp:Transcript_28591/g.91919  ORF Transcript_28591/g.91919 Transcript_28591/m.91919 type:complete len:1215 (+) Transcript_28591:125-3769(+)